MLGGEQRRQPAVGDLRRQRRVLRPDRGDVDRDPLLHGRDRQLQRLARPVGQRQLERLAVEDSPARAPAPSARPRRTRACAAAAGRSAARASPRPPAARSSRSRAASARPRAGRSSPRSSRSSRAERAGIWKIAEPSLIVDGRLGEPGEDRRRVGAVGLGGPDAVVAEPLGLLHELRAAAGASSPRPQYPMCSPSFTASVLPAVVAARPRRTVERVRDPITALERAIRCLPARDARARCSRASARTRSSSAPTRTAAAGSARCSPRTATAAA